MAEQKTPFAELLQEYMWQQRPPWTVTKLSRVLGVARTTIWNWLNEGRVPLPTMLPQISEKTGIPLADLYRAAGYPVPASQSEDAIVETLVHMSPEERQRVLDRMDEWLAEVRRTDESPKAVAGAVW